MGRPIQSGPASAPAFPRILAVAVSCYFLYRLEPAAAGTLLSWLAWLSAVGATWLAASGGALLRGRRNSIIAAAVLAAGALALTAVSDHVRLGHLLWLSAAVAAAGPLGRAWEFAVQTHGSARGEGWRWLLLTGGALALLHPYTTARFVGGGDARIYAQTLADFLAQVRLGEFPVLAAQSAFAPNGEIHPLRTAPAFYYVGGLVDLVTWGAFPAVAVQNIVIVAHGLAAAFTSYLALSAANLQRGHGWLAALFAALFLTSPGVLAPLFGGDLIASWLTLPWLPLLVLAWTRTVDTPEDFRWPLLATVALAALWLAHAPIAFWGTLCSLPFGLFAGWSRLRRHRGGEIVGLCGLFAALAGFVFASVFALDLPDDPNIRAAVQAGAIEASLSAAWQGFLRPVSPDASALLTDLQLSPALWLMAAVSILAVGRVPRTSFQLLLLIGGALVVLLLPLTGRTIWPAMPDLVLASTEKWPSQRLFLLLSAVVPFLGLAAFTAWSSARPRFARDLGVVLLLTAAWSVLEAGKFVRRGWSVTHSAAATAEKFLPANLPLPRYSFEYFGALPRTFSHGPVPPAAQLRLLAQDSLEVIVQNTTTPLQMHAPATALAFQSTNYGGQFSALQIPPNQVGLLNFEFGSAPLSGALQIEGPSLRQEFSLPSSGEEFAFGSAPGNARTLLIENAGVQPLPLAMKFIRAGGAEPTADDLRVRVHFLPPQSLPLRVKALVPLELEVDAPRAAWLETARVWIPGYRARVAGGGVETVRSPDGYVMLPVPAGNSRVTLEYRGPWRVQAAFWLSAGTWAALLAVSYSRAAASWIAPRFAFVGTAVLFLWAAGLASTWLTRPREQALPAQSSALSAEPNELRLRFPIGRPNGTVELLAEIAGSRMRVLLVCVDGKHAQIAWQSEAGHERRGPVFPVNYRAVQHVRLSRALDSEIPIVRVNERLALAPASADAPAPR